MRTLALAAAGMLAATACLAQGTSTTTTGNMTTGTAPAQRAAPETTGTTDALKPGANSFTESQARGRIESNGFSNVQGLAKDENGIWRGKAMKDGKAMNVAVDFRGDVSTTMN